nr:ribonuclease H-like domain-containing protein [Tanacetum cinerariifolium]
MGFIDGIYVKPVTGVVLAQQWERCIVIVLGWILSSLSLELYLGQFYSKIASDGWDELQETYDKMDGYVIFNVIHMINGLKQERYKARLVVKGYNQREGIDYEETISHVDAVFTRNIGDEGVVDTAVTGLDVATTLNYLNPVQSGSHDMLNMGPISYINFVSPTSSSQNGSAKKNGGEQVSEPVIEFPSSYATKLSPTSLTKADLHKLKANVPNDADYNVYYARVPIEINACNAFSDNFVMVVPNLKVVNSKDNGKGQTSGADDEGTSKASTSGYNKESPSNKGNGFFSLNNSFEALNVENPIIEKVATSNKATTFEGKLVLVDNDGKPLENVDYPVNAGSEDEVEHDDKETTKYLASKPRGLDMVLRAC